MEQGIEKLDHWVIIELFGHQRIAGFASETVIAGSAFIQVDVPAVGNDKAFTRLYGPSAIYSMTFVDEETAKRAVGAIRPAPITVYIPAARALPEHRIRIDDEENDVDGVDQEDRYESVRQERPDVERFDLGCE